MSYTDYSIRSFQGGYDKNLTYLVTCMQTSNQLLVDASVPLGDVSPFINRRGLITLFITHTHNDHTAFRVDWMPFAGLKHSGHGVGGIKYTMHEMQVEKMMILRN